MGCDIHLYQEVKVGGVWWLYSTPRIDRWYALFGKMAGVRGDGPAIIAPKGIPEDASAITRLCLKDWKLDAHNHSWLDTDEIGELERWIVGQRIREQDDFISVSYDLWGYCNGDDWSNYKPESTEGIEDVRFVFWFDN